MKYLDLTCADGASNLACDQALLEFYENYRPDDGVIRFWAPSEYFVVLGHANQRMREVNWRLCSSAGIPVLRRCSGGGTVLQGPGCFNYTLVIPCSKIGSDSVRVAFEFVLSRHRRAVQEVFAGDVSIAGISDLAVDDRKFSGNAQYRKRDHVMIHGTFLLGFDLSVIERYLALPSKQPHYRHSRSHMDFLTNLDVDTVALRQALMSVWRVDQLFVDVPGESIRRLTCERYEDPRWNDKF